MVIYSALLVILLITCVYMVSTLNYSTDNVNRTNAAYCRQVTNALEMLLNQSKYQTYRFVFNDSGIGKLVEQTHTQRSALVDLVALMKKTLQCDPYFESVYLYSRTDKWILSATSLETQMCAEEDFEDQEIVEKLREGNVALLEPRIIKHKGLSEAVILPIIVPVNTDGVSGNNCMIVANINVGEMFGNLLKNVNADENIDMYITRPDGKIIIAQDFARIGMQLSDLGYDVYSDSVIRSMFTGREICYRADYESNLLGWTLNMYQTGSLSALSGIDLGSIFVLVALACGMVIAGMLLVLQRAMRPVSEMDNESYERSIKEQMLSPELLPDHAFSFRHDWYFVVMVQFPKGSGKRLEQALAQEITWPDNIEHHLISIQVEYSALVVSFSGEARERFWRDWLAHTHRRLETVLDEKIFFTVSTLRASTCVLSEAYQETMLLINYTMQAGQARVLYSSDVRLPLGRTAYPEALEKQLINNLLVGNTDTCRAIIDEFVGQLFSTENQLQNQDILLWLTQLKNRVLLQTNIVPPRLPERIRDDFTIWDTRESIDEKLTDLMRIIVGCINKRTEEKSENLEIHIREYVQTNFADPNFSFTGICDHFAIGRSQLTTIFRDKLGGSFSEYVNDLKIERAKQLLADKNLTIDMIAHQSGFSYAHYFIKVFKAREGITPGQYREHISATSGSAAESDGNDHAQT